MVHVAIILLPSLRMSKRSTGSLLSLGVTELPEFTGCILLIKKRRQLACDCGRSCCHATVLDELVQDVLPRSRVLNSDEPTRGAIANDGYECSATSGGNSTLNSSVVETKTSPAGPECNPPGHNPGKRYVRKYSHFHVVPFGVCVQIMPISPTHSETQSGKSLRLWMPHTIQIPTCETLSSLCNYRFVV